MRPLGDSEIVKSTLRRFDPSFLEGAGASNGATAISASQSCSDTVCVALCVGLQDPALLEQFPSTLDLRVRRVLNLQPACTQRVAVQVRAALPLRDNALQISPADFAEQI